MLESHPALRQLEERLKVNGVTADPRAVASALLGLARLSDWPEHPDRIVAWLLQLALDVAKEPH